VCEQDGSFLLSEDHPLSIGKVQAFYGNVLILIRAYCYIRSLGPDNLKRVSQLAVLNANYLKERLRGTLHLAYDRPCMHECVFSDRLQTPYHVSTLDMAKRLIDYGFHPPTIYFPLVVPGAIMIEPTETESRETLDGFVAAMEAIAAEARENPALLHDAPVSCRVRRLDEATAARTPCLCGCSDGRQCHANCGTPAPALRSRRREASGSGSSRFRAIFLVGSQEGGGVGR
jgi:glycine dehydrogenase subunit 2